MTRRQIIGAILGIILGIAVALITPPKGLTPHAMYALGIIVWAVINWILEVAADYIIAIAMCTLWVLFNCIPFKVAFATFSDSTWWLLLGALGMGLAVTKSGLLKRISLLVMRIFPATFNGQMLALISAGTIISPLIPSMTAKAAIVAPISLGISNAMGYKHKSRGAAGIFGAMYLGFILTGPMFISASFIGYVMRSLLPASVQAQFNWTTWFVAGLVWTVCVLVLTYVTLRFLYTPTEKDSLPAYYAAKQLAELGPMTVNEKITAIVLLLALLGWMTEPLHGVNATVVALICLVILLVFKVFDRSDFRTGMGWDNMIFMGGIINLGIALPSLNIDKWISDMAGPIIAPMMSNMYIFVVVLAISIYAVRYILVSFTATTVIFTVLLLPFALQANINPWVTGFIVYCSTNIWNMFYQNTTFLTSYYATGGEMVTHKQMKPLSYAYCTISIIALLLSIPYWKFIGLIP